jgi:hypothetical protein
MSLRDRMLRGQIVIGVVGPVATGDRAHYVEALQRIARRGPWTRVALRSRPHDPHWYFDPDDTDRWCEQLVTELPPAETETIGAVALEQARIITSEHPLHFFIAGDYVIQVGDHMLGDGKGFVDRMAAVVKMGAGDTELPEWTTTKFESFPLWKAARDTLLRDSTTRRRLFAARRAEIGAHENERDNAAETVLWRPQRAAAHVVVPATRLREIQAWAREPGRGATVSSAILVLIRKAFLSAGLPLQRSQTVIYDVRRYLHDGAGQVGGNFVTGLPLRVDDIGDPRQVAEAMNVQLNSARPLAALLMGVGQYLASRKEATVISERRSAPAAHLVFNNLGAARSLQRLPWTAERDERNLTIIVPAESPEQVTVTVAGIASCLQVTAAFHANVFDEDTVRRALRHFAEAPLGVLMEHHV